MPRSKTSAQTKRSAALEEGFNCYKSSQSKYIGQCSAGSLPAPVIPKVNDWEALEDDEMEE